jgi:hypothetical protein
MKGRQGLQPGGDIGIDGALPGKPSPQRIAVLASTSRQFPLGPPQREQTDGQAVWRHRRQWRRHVSILDTTVVDYQEVRPTEYQRV